MFNLGAPWWEIVIRSFAVYALILVGMRLMGKRELGQITLVDLVIILLIANAVQNAMVGPDVSLIGGLLAAGVLLATNRLVSELRVRSRWWRRLLEGNPTLLIENGRLLSDNLKREGLAPDEIEMAMRERGFASMNEVKQAFLETDGTISFIDHASRIARTRKHIRQFRH